MKNLSQLAAAWLVFAPLSAAGEKAQAISPDNPAFVYEGRIDFSDTAAPVIVWQGSRIRIDFTGTELSFAFSDLRGQSYFNGEIDGQPFVLTAENGAVPCPIELAPREHSLLLSKRSEPDAGWVAFRGIRIADTASVSKPTLPDYAMRMLFYGDSITAGANNEDGEVDQWEDRSTHNNAQTYAAMTARAFDADYRNIAVSGMGISIGYKDFTAPEVWNRVYPDRESARADLAGWMPDVVFLNFGENDDSFSKNDGLPFPADFVERYVAMVRAMRAAYPDSRIFILRGGMSGGAKSERLRAPWEKIVATLESTDAKIRHFAFEHWTPQHPRVADHRIMADELIAWLREQGL